MEQNIAENNGEGLFRAKSIARISSPEELTKHLKVTSPGIWAVLAVVILLLGALFIWSMIGTLETKAAVKVIVKDHQAQVVTDGTGTIASGMPLRILSENYNITSTAKDEYGRTYGITEVSLPDGSYEGTVVIEQIRPIEFLIESR